MQFKWKMGSLISMEAGNSGEEVDYHLVSLPPPRYIDSVGHTIETRNDSQAPPTNIRVDRQILSFGVDPESVSSCNCGSECSIIFKYFSITKLVVSIRSGDLCLTAELPPTSPSQFSTSSVPLGRDLPVPELALEFTDSKDCIELIVNSGNQGRFRARSMRMKFPDGRMIDMLKLFGGSDADSILSMDGVTHRETPNVHASCAICLSEPAVVGFIPCRHVCVCNECAYVTLKSSLNHCPICRESVYSVIRLENT